MYSTRIWIVEVKLLLAEVEYWDSLLEVFYVKHVIFEILPEKILQKD